MDNLRIYKALESTPKSARKRIDGGRLQGKTNINPMWRIKALTELFGACGFGWKIEIKDKWMEQGADGQVAAFVDIELYVKDGDVWSEAIPATGGNMFVEKERTRMHTDDECYKMALTDAIGGACKMLGMSSDIYWEEETTKYDQRPQREPPRNEWASAVQGAQRAMQNDAMQMEEPITEAQYEELKRLCATPEGQPDAAKITRLNDIRQRLGYERVLDIKQKDYEKVVEEFNK